MSMLAERRQRRRYNLVPRGKALYEDGNRFGTKMLEKMGWNKEKGLGAKEDGQKEFIRIRYKHDNEGLGYEERDDQWTEHESNYDGLLKSLGSELGTENGSQDLSFVGFEFRTEPGQIAISGESLEAKSKRSKARVHYTKFTRGKDISRYSEKDLANIFGKKSLGGEEFSATCNSEGKNSSETVSNIEEATKDEPRFGVMTISTGTSISDYFKAKMNKIKNKFETASVTMDHPIDEEETFIPDRVANEEIANALAQRNLKSKKQGRVDDKQINQTSDDVRILKDEKTTKKSEKQKLEKGDRAEDECGPVEEIIDPQTIEKSKQIAVEITQVNPEASESLESERELKKSKKNTKEIEAVFEIQETEIVKLKSKNRKRCFTEDNKEANEVASDRHESERKSSKTKQKSKAVRITEEYATTETQKEQTLVNNSQEICRSQTEALGFEIKSTRSKGKKDKTGAAIDPAINDPETNLRKKSKKIKRAQEISGADEEAINNNHITIPTKLENAVENEKLLQKSKLQPVEVKSKKLQSKRKSRESDGINDDELAVKKTENSEAVTVSEIAITHEDATTKKSKKIRKQSSFLLPSFVSESKSEPSRNNEVSSDTTKPIQVLTASASQKISANQFCFPELIRKKKKKFKNIQPETMEVSASSATIANNNGETIANNDENSGQIIKLNSYKAEKFQNIDMEAFSGSNFPLIIGYGQDSSMKIQIVEKVGDTERIQRMYGDVFNKYAEYEPQKMNNCVRKPHRVKVKKMKKKTMFPLSIGWVGTK